MNILYPKIRLQHLPALLKHAAIGALLAGVYGIVHDQITFSISSEYFTRLKFPQFHYVDFGLPPRVFVAEVGFLATWWVGFVAGWFLARKTVPRFESKVAFVQSLKGFGIVFAAALVGSALGYLASRSLGPDADLSRWEYLAAEHGVQDLRSFVRVAYIHNASYLGGFAGLIVAMVYVHKSGPAAGMPPGRSLGLERVSQIGPSSTRS